MISLQPINFVKDSIKKLQTVLTGIFYAWVLVVAAGGIVAQPTEASWKWADSVMATLSPEEKIGQLFMVAAYSNKGPEHLQELEKLVKEKSIGGFIFFQGGPHRQARMTNHLQSQSKVPLWIGMDAEWGLGMRLDSCLNFPKQMTLGAIQDKQLIQKMGEIMGRHCQRLGVHINFAPVMDINSNPANPVIGYRAFGEDKEWVAERGIALLKGLQSQKVIAVAKHFPGHGDAETDSHYALPIISQSKTHIENHELYPFKEAIRESVGGIMVAHLNIPALDNTPNTASTLSKKIVNDLLKKELGFEGLVFTDALNMKGVSKYFAAGEADVKALLAGNDVLLFPENPIKAIAAIEAAVAKKQIRWKELDKRIRKILAWKHWAGAASRTVVSTDNLYQDLNQATDKAFIQSLYAQAITLLKNRHQTIPIRAVDSTSFASILIGQDLNTNTFQKNLSNYAPFTHFQLPEKADKKAFDDLARKVEQKTVIVAFNKIANLPSKKYNITPEILDFLKELRLKSDVIVVVFGNAYASGILELNPGLICAYEWNGYTQSLVPEIIFGARTATGKIPVSTGATIKFGLGYLSPKLQRLRQSEPEEVGFKSQRLARIDSIAHYIIKEKMTPGCQILVAKDGAVVYNKGFGYQTYDSLSPVTDETLYDIASITKVAATLQAIMYLHEKGQINVWDKASDYLPELKGTNKENMPIADILVHQAGLQPFIPYWKRTLKTSIQSETFYCNEKDGWFSTEVVPGLYSMKRMEDTLWKWVVQSDLLEKNKKGTYDYKYSDLGYYILKKLAETQLNEPLDVFLNRRFYQPLGLTRLGYLPKRKFSETEIAPTEFDTLFRKAAIRGNVHDPGAAMFGGVAGHAGLFANAWSLAVLMQMNLNLGYYGGKYLLVPPTLTFFTKRHFSRNRRGLGWDKPYLWSKDGPTSQYCSPQTFGHTGFTGTCVWADPKYNLIFVFLSNRVYPDADNSKLIKYNIRPKIHDLVYEAMQTTADVALAPEEAADTLQLK